MDEKHGQGKEFKTWNKETRIGQWVNDQKQGEFEIIYENGTKRMTKYRDGKEVKE